jgi:2'-5' RNA ligase
MTGRLASHGAGISLWLVPDEPERDRLAGLIADLARRFEASAFPPHVTLLSGLRTREGEAIRRGAEMCRALEPIHLRASRIETRPSHFRCLALRVEETLGLLTTRAQAAISFDHPEEDAYEPHLTLLYAEPRLGAEAAALAEVKDAVPVRFGVNRLEVWRTTGPVTEWKALGGWPLGPTS